MRGDILAIARAPVYGQFMESRDRKTGSSDGTLYDAIHRQYGRALRVFFRRRTLTEADADDLLQTLYLRLLRQGDPGAIRNVEAFLFVAAQNLVRDHARNTGFRTQVNVQLAETGWLDEAEMPDTERIVLARDLVKQAARALAALPPMTRHIFVLHRFENYSYRALAAELGIGVGEVRGHVERALRALAEATGSQDSHNARSRTSKETP